MEDDDCEFLRRLFVAATELSETAQEAAIAGQASALAASDYADTARRLLAAARGTRQHRRAIPRPPTGVV